MNVAGGQHVDRNKQFQRSIDCKSESISYNASTHMYIIRVACLRESIIGEMWICAARHPTMLKHAWLITATRLVAVPLVIIAVVFSAAITLMLMVS